MTATLEEFSSTLHGGFTSRESGLELHQAEQGQWRIDGPEQGFSVAITADNAATRQLGALTLPRLNVALVFSGADTTQHEAFLKRFRHYFHKGGG